MFLPTPQTAPRLIAAALLLATGTAMADCQSDFARDNRVKPEAGPFKVTEARTPQSKLEDGRWVNSLRQGAVNSVTEVVPARKAFRVTSDARFGTHYVGIGQRAWMKSLPDGAWEALDAETAAAFANATQTYVLAEDMSDLICSDAQDKGKGRAVRIYRYHVPGDGLTSTLTAINAQFDARSGLPLATTAEGMGKANAFKAVGHFVFDRKIDIRPPVKDTPAR